MRPFFTMTLLFLLPFAVPAQNKSAPSASDKDAVAKTLSDYAKAMSEFDRTRDFRPVIKFLTKEYYAIEDGEGVGYRDLEAGYLGEVGNQLQAPRLADAEDPALRFTVIKVTLLGNVAYARLKYTYKSRSGNRVTRTRAGLCTEILVKTGDTWLIEQEHYSTKK